MLQTELTAPVRARARMGLIPVRSKFTFVENDSTVRRWVEQRIRQAYGAHFGACITGFMTRFACYEHASGATGIIGVRPAAEERLFLERYLARSIEDTIREACSRPVSREAIAEVGQFVVDDPRIAADFFRDLVPLLAGQGFDWVCFTGTRKIRAILRRIGFKGMPVARGDASVAADSGDHWGSYYENEPVVIVGKLADPAGRWCRSAGSRLAGPTEA